MNTMLEKRERQDFPVLTIETPYGKLSATGTADNASFYTTPEEHLTINGIEYNVTLHFAKKDGQWIMENHIHATRKDWIKIQEMNGTTAGRKIIREEISACCLRALSLHKGFIASSERINVHNQIADLQKDEEELFEKLKKNRQKQEELLSLEQSLDHDIQK